MTEKAPSPAEALAELQEILRAAAITASLQRVAAARYTICRDIVLKSPLRAALPGFLLQCLTISRFHDFIHLLDPDVGVRLAFLDASFQSSATRFRGKRTFDVFGDPEF